MQIAQTKRMGLVDQNGVGIGNVDAALDDGGRHQHIVGPVDEIGHDALQLFSIHLTMANAHACIGHQAVDHACHLADVADPVVHEIRLATARNLICNGVPDQLLVEGANLRFHRVAIGRRRIDDAQIPGAHERKLQGPRNRSGR